MPARRHRKPHCYVLADTGAGAGIQPVNVADFMPLAAQRAGAGKAHTGLIFTNPKRFNRATVAYPANVIAALRAFLTDPPITGKSWIWWV